MKIRYGRERGAASALRSGTFVGEVWGDPVLVDTDGVVINNVFFAPRGRTNWHTHDGPQVLVVMAGLGHVYTRAGEGGEIRAGDIVHVAPGEEHWHGAASGSYLLHTAITFGGHDWLAPVTEEEYAADVARGNGMLVADGR